MKRIEEKILYIQTNAISLLDIPRVLEEMGYDVYQVNFEVKTEGYDHISCRKLVKAIGRFHIQCAVSYDFIISIAQACLEAGIPYIAWVYDAPQSELYTHYAMYPCNYIFAFDKMQVRRLREIGIKHVEHMPLAVHAEKMDMVVNTIGKKIKGGYQREIAFIGQLYKKYDEKALLNQMEESVKQQFYQNIDACFLKWDKDIHMHGLMSEDVVAFFEKLAGWNELKKKYPYVSGQFYFEAAVLSRILANRERVHILNKLAEKYDVTLYTNDQDTEQLSERVKVKPGVSYDVLPYIYHRSKINLNITLHCIETGVPQRVLDVMASGGFMLSNYQEELEEMFVPGEEIVLYHNEQELEELVAYYLAHDDAREKIARKGQEKVLREFHYRKGLTKALKYVHEAEKDRTESYIALQRKTLREQTDFLLAQRTRQAYLQLLVLYNDKVYETAIFRTNDLHNLWTMIAIWNSEERLGITTVFANVDNIMQAEQKYLEVKHGLWRVEQGLSHEKCVDGLERMRQNKISKYFMSWMAHVNLDKKEETLVKLSQLMAETSLTEAVELLSYGLLFLKESPELLIQKAEFLMELNLWEEALKTLQMLPEPAEEIREIMRELSGTLYGTDGQV